MLLARQHTEIQHTEILIEHCFLDNMERVARGLCAGDLLEKVSPRALLQNLAHPAAWLSKVERHTAGGLHFAFLFPAGNRKAKHGEFLGMGVWGKGPFRKKVPSPREAISTS
ncbi:hypothetical protein AMJ85_08150 [candidate division BRC1 bacterium SM23_51]|nr:MAG: hypothetical protein AMJ85_08150 [candidate division BRC1 bacterium SM23_51]